MKLLKYISGFMALLWVTALHSGCEKGPNFKEYTYPAPVVEDFFPKTDYAGADVTLTGKDFGANVKAVKVFFGGVKADTIRSVADDQIIVKAPVDGISGIIVVQVWTHEDSTVSAFTFLPPSKVSGISPEAGQPGDQVTINGENFGTDPSRVSVLFKDNVQASIISVEDTKIVVTVPDGGITGAITVNVGPQVLTGPVFNYPLVGLNYEFNTNGDNEGWVPQQNGTWQVADGKLKVTFDPAQFSTSKRRADLKLNGGTSIHAGNFPIVAIKMDKPKTCNVIFDTNLGSFGNGSNKWTGILIGDVYYYDLSATPFGTSNFLSATQQTDFTTFQFKIADVTSAETGYSVDWIKSFENMNELLAYIALPTGKMIFEFDNAGNNEGWKPQQGGTWTVGSGALNVTFTQTTGKKRSDLALLIGGNGSPVTIHTGNYPIMAVKFNKPSTCNVTFDTNMGSFGNGSNKYATDYTAQDAYYWDMSTLSIGGTGAHPNEEITFGSTFQFKIADVPEAAPETGYSVQWIRTFESKQALEDFINK